MLDMPALIQQCAPAVDPQTMSALVQVESNAHPHAIGIVGGRLIRQPASHEEAVATAHQLEKTGWNFSVGLGQINYKYLVKHKISYDQAFKACPNLLISSKIFQDCYIRAKKYVAKPQAVLQAALSCYYSGNFWRGFQPEHKSKPSYVQKVIACTHSGAKPIPVVPSVQEDGNASLGNSIVAPFHKLPSDNAPVLLPSWQTDNAKLQSRFSSIDQKDKKEIILPKKQDEDKQGYNVLVF